MNQPRFDYDGRGGLILCSEGREVIGHRGEDESPRWLFRAEDEVVGLAITDAGVVVVDRVGAVVCLDETGAVSSRRQVQDEVRGLAATPSGALALLGAHGLHLELAGGSRTLEASGLRCAAFSSDGSKLAVGHEDGLIRVLRLPGGELLGEHRLERSVADLCALPAGGWLAASGDRVLRVVADGSSSARLTGLSGVEIGGVLMRSDGALFGIVYDRRAVVHLAYPSLETVANFEYADKEVTNLAFGPHPWVGIGLSGGDGNKVNLYTGAMHRTDTHPERQHHSWLVMKSVEAELAQRLLGGQPARAPAAAGGPLPAGVAGLGRAPAPSLTGASVTEAAEQARRRGLRNTLIVIGALVLLPLLFLLVRLLGR